MNATVDRIVAIHGAPRSGTSWLGQLFNSNEHVAYRYQPLFSYAFKSRLTTSSERRDIERFVDELLLSRDDFVLQRGKASLAGYELSFAKDLITHLVYKEVRYHEILENLLEREPRLMVIGIVRDPRAVIHSWLRAPREFEVTWDPMDEWRAATKKNAGKTENWYGFERWKELATLFERLRGRFPNTFHILRYEELVAQPERATTTLFNRCGLAMTQQTLEFLHSSRARHDGSAYGVFRDAQEQAPDWRRELNPHIVASIQDDLGGGPLEHYLRPFPIQPP